MVRHYEGCPGSKAFIKSSVDPPNLGSLEERVGGTTSKSVGEEHTAEIKELLNEPDSGTGEVKGMLS